MHEVSICRALLQQVETIAREADAVQVRQVRLCIGPLSCVVPELLERAFPEVSHGTLAQGAVLDIVLPPLRLRCLSCGAESLGKPEDLTCRSCGSWQTHLLSGDQLVLESVGLVARSDLQGARSEPEGTHV